MTDVRDTSRQAYEGVMPTIGNRQAMVLQVLKRAAEPMSNSEIANELGWKINQVTGRTKELRDAKLVVEAGRRACRVTGENVLTWAVSEHQKTLLDAAVPAKEGKKPRFIGWDTSGGVARPIYEV